MITRNRGKRSEYRARSFPRPIACGLALITALIATGCAGQSAREEASLAALKQALPGTYASTSAGGAAPVGSSNEVSLSIKSAVAQAVGETVFYVRETAAKNERLVLAERIWTLELDDKGNLLQHFYVLRDPRRWIAAADRVDVLISLLPEDLEPLPGCDLTWRRSPTGFESTPQKGVTCQGGGSVRGLWVEQRIKLEGGELTLAERQFGQDGTLLPAGSSESTLVLRKGGGRTGSLPRAASPTDPT